MYKRRCLEDKLDRGVVNVYNNYEINNETLALLYIKENLTKVVEISGSFTVDNNIINIVDHSCKFFGSSYLGRIEGSKNLIGMNYKLPIIIEESREFIFFPTIASKNKDCMWISLNNMEKYYKDGKNSIIKFKNNVSLKLPISFGSLENQVHRSNMLLLNLKKRKKVS